MSIAFVAAGAAATGSTSLSVPYPAGLSAGMLLVLAVSNKYPTNGPSTPSGFTLLAQVSGGAGSAGADAGQVYSTVYYKVSDGTESGNLTVTLTSSNSAVGRMFAYSKTESSWDLAATTDDDTSAGASMSFAFPEDPGVTANDMIVVAMAVNGTGATFSSHATTQSGVTFDALTERQDSGTTTGDNCGLVVIDRAVSSGTSSAAPSYTSTANTTFGSYPAGAAVFIRLREVAGGGGTTFEQALSASVTRSATADTASVFGQALSATTTRSATMSAAAVIAQSIGATITRAASALAEYTQGNGPIQVMGRWFVAIKSNIKSAISSAFDKNRW